MTGEGGERLVPPGPRGPKGEPGAAGLSKPVRRALVYLFVLALLLDGANFLWSGRQQHAYEVSVTRQEQAYEAFLKREHAAHVRQDAMLIGKLCLTFARLGDLKPPPGNPKTNPSRAYLQEEHATEVELGADLGCKGT